MRRCVASLLCVLAVTTVATGADDAGGGEVVPNHEGIAGFAPEWDPSEFDLAGYFEGLDPDAAVWYQHVQTLANPWFGGRRPGSRGDALTTEYIAWNLSRSGLEPAFTDATGSASWLQPLSFSLRGTAPEVRAAEFSFGDSTGQRGVDFEVLAPSGSGDLNLPLSFAGYGIESGREGYSSFDHGDDFTGRVVLLLRYEPLDADGESRWTPGDFSRHSGLRGKLTAIADRGAAAILLVNPDTAHGSTGLETPASSVGFGPSTDIPVLHVAPDTAAQLVAHASSGATTLPELQASANALDTPEGDVIHFGGDRTIQITTDVEPPAYDTWNVAGIIPGHGSLKDQWVVLGGHYDHLGHGYTGSRTPEDDRVHPGADDNASGIGALLVLADRLATGAASDEAARRSAIVAFFGGEEAGLHGSRHFIANPPMDLDRTNFMLNLDMMGRLRGGTVALSGTGTAAEFDEMLPRLVEPTGLTVKTTPSGLGPSDHSNFYRANVPVLFFFTGIHDDYHTPRDIASRVNPEGTARIIDLCERILLETMHEKSTLTFVESTSGTPARQSGSRVRLGVMPSYTTADEPGVLIDGVTEGTSAAEAGLKAGDIIVAWDGEAIDGGADLMKHLRGHEPGDAVTITIERGGERVHLPVTLKASE
ncbi:MAG: M28 family peptidase [Phycisphaerales bacterium]|nr:M28 family peptidase [Phycisphaerales bacterium]